jgi:small subunit ribosomal protein S1
VKNFTDFGMFLGIGNGIDGLVHMSEISWSRRKKPISEVFKKGMSVEAKVLQVDKEQKKFSLSIKRLQEDPWRGVADRHRTQDVVEGYVTSITDFGVFVEIEDGVEGLVHLSEMDDLQGKHPSEVFKLDDLVKTSILNIDERERRIALSIKSLAKKVVEEKTVESFMNKNEVISTLGDVFEQAMKAKETP